MINYKSRSCYTNNVNIASCRPLGKPTGIMSAVHTTRIGALHDGLLSSQTVKNASRLTYDDDRRIRHVSHVINMLDQLEPSQIGMFFRHESLASNNSNRLFSDELNRHKISTRHLPRHLLMLDVTWLLPCHISTRPWPIIQEVHLFSDFWPMCSKVFFI
jgi:hypothetical protein